MTNTRQQYQSYHFPTIDGDGHDGPVPKDGGNARQRFRTALGSLDESVAALRVAAAWGYVTEAAVIDVIAEMRGFGSARRWGRSTSPLRLFRWRRLGAT